MRKALKVVLLAIACVILSISAIACGHEHTFKDTWSYSAEKHWKDASCGHEEKIDEADHVFNNGELNSDRSKIIYTCSVCEYQKEETVNHKYGEGVLSADKTKITYTCSECGEVWEEAHNHLYGTWIIDVPASILKEGSMHRNCLLPACGYLDEQVVEKVKVESISVTTKPNKVSYKIGETFDKTGMVVTAKGVDGSTADVTSLITIEEKTLVFGTNEILVSYGSYTTKVYVTADGNTVHEARYEASVDDELLVIGYYVGVSQDGPNEKEELLIKDRVTDDIISVRGVTYSSLEQGFGYKYGDLIQVKSTLKKETKSGLADKLYLEFSEENPEKASDTVISSGNKIDYLFDDAAELPNYKNWNTYVGKTAAPYTYVHITGIFYTSKFTGSADNKLVAVVSADTNIMGWDYLKVGGRSSGRFVTLRNNVMTQNLGEDWLEYFGGDLINYNSSSNYIKTGYMKEVDFYAIYTGGNGSYAQINVLSEDWLNQPYTKETTELTSQDIIREVALSYYRQNSQIQYNQTMSRRNINATPESATEQHLTYLDCSSFANAVLYEALGINIIPDEAVDGVDITTSDAQTGRIATYAKKNEGVSADVLGYYVKSDFSASKKDALVQEIEDYLQVGDVLNYRAGTGHIMMYLGDGLWIHSRGGDYYDDDLTSASLGHDQGWGYEKSEGTVGFLYSEDIFHNPDSGRYVVGTKSNVSILRLVNRVGATPTTKTLTRMQYRGLDAEKTLDAGVNSSVQKGQELTYTITIRNHSLTDYKGVEIKEVLDSNVTLVSAPTGYSVNAGVLTFNVDVPSYKEVKVSFKVKVNANTPAGTIIRSEQTTVAGIVQAKTINSVAGLTTTQLSAVANKAKEYATNARKFDNAMDFVETLYSEAVGVTIPNYTTVGSALDDILDIDADVLKNTDIAKLVAPNLYGGRSMSNAYIRDKEVIRMIEQYHLTTGDVIIAEFDKREKNADGDWVKTGVIEYVIYVYVGGNELVAYTNEANVTTSIDTPVLLTMSDRRYESSHILVTIFNYDRYAVIRPSMA